MLCANQVTVEKLCFQVRYLQRPFSLFDEWQVFPADRLFLMAGDCHLDFPFHLRDINPQVSHDPDGQSFAFTDNSQQQVLQADIIVTQSLRFFPAVY